MDEGKCSNILKNVYFGMVSIKCPICGATAWHINRITNGYEIVCMTAEGKNHKMMIRGIQEDGLAQLS